MARNAHIRAANAALEPFLLSPKERAAMIRKDGEMPFRILGRIAFEDGRDIPLRIPVTPPGRGETAAGSTTFHFKMTPMSRKAVPLFRGKPLLSRRSDNNNADDFEEYLDRPGSAQTVTSPLGGDHQTYLERPGSGEDRDRREGRPRAFSNISTERAERLEYWCLTQAHERFPRTHQLVFYPDRCPAFWQAIRKGQFIDEEVLEHMFKVRAAHEEYERVKGPEAKRFRAEPMSVTAEQAGDFLWSVRDWREFAGRFPPVEFKSGRGGRYQFRIEAELPHELSPEDREEIVATFCAFLDSLGLMYTTVLHGPGKGSDRRNFHMHVIFHDRPARLIEVALPLDERQEGGPSKRLEWDFAFAVRKVDEKGRKSDSYPHRQPKVAMVSQSYKVTKNPNSGTRFAGHLRRVFADMVNRLLECRGWRRRYDAGSYRVLGIKLRPLEHLGKRMAGLEREGIPTSKGSRNAVLRYGDFERNIFRWRERLRRENRAWLADATGRLNDVRAEPGRTNQEVLRALIEDRFRLRDEAIVLDSEQALFWLRCEQARSRAERVIAAPSPPRQRYAGRPHWQKPGEAALLHLQAIDRAVEPHRAPLEDLARNLNWQLDLAKLFDAEIGRCFDDPGRQIELARRATPLVTARVAQESENPALPEIEQRSGHAAAITQSQWPASPSASSPSSGKGTKESAEPPPMTNDGEPISVRADPPATGAKKAKRTARAEPQPTAFFDQLYRFAALSDCPVLLEDGLYRFAPNSAINSDVMRTAMAQAGAEYVQSALNSLYRKQNAPTPAQPMPTPPKVTEKISSPETSPRSLVSSDDGPVTSGVRPVSTTSSSGPKEPAVVARSLDLDSVSIPHAQHPMRGSSEEATPPASPDHVVPEAERTPPAPGDAPMPGGAVERQVAPQGLKAEAKPPVTKDSETSEPRRTGRDDETLARVPEVPAPPVEVAAPCPSAPVTATPAVRSEEEWQRDVAKAVEIAKKVELLYNGEGDPVGLDHFPEHLRWVFKDAERQEELRQRLREARNRLSDGPWLNVMNTRRRGQGRQR